MSDIQDKVSKLRKNYKVERGIVRSPGKFEGEPLYVPYYWGEYLDGGADDDEGCTLKFNVTTEERKALGIPKRKKVVRIMETEQGFVVEASKKVVGSCRY